jgi:hypothetical protein
MNATRRFTRFGLLAILAAALVAAGCSDSDSVTTGAQQGQVRVVFSAATVAAATTESTTFDTDGPRIQAAEITLSSILARNLDGELVPMTIDLPVTIDLIGLVQGGTVELPMGALPAGMYDQIVVVIRALSVTLLDGTEIEVTPPGGGWTAIVPTTPFEVLEGQVTTIELRFRPWRALRWIEDHFEFHPEFDCDVDDDRGDDDDDD